MKSIIQTWKEDTVCDVNAFGAMMRGLKKEQESWLMGKLCKDEKIELVQDFVEKAVRFDHLKDMVFWGLYHPGKMPSDARVGFLYMPSYYVMSMMMDAYRHFPEVRRIEGIDALLRDGLNGCMGRGFMGHGYDSDSGFLDTMVIFGDFRVDLFLAEYPEINPAFVAQFERAMKYLGKLERGEVRDAWTKMPYKEAEFVVRRFRGEKAVLPVFVYGTLKHDEPAHHLMADAYALGDAVIKDHALVNLGAYPGMIHQEDRVVRGELYFVSYKMLRKLDEYEGEGSLYRRTNAWYDWDGNMVCVKVYLYLGDVKRKRKMESWTSRGKE